MFKPEPEKVILLSMKYNIEKKKVEDVLSEYLPYSFHRSTESIFSRIYGKKITSSISEDKNYQEILNELSIKYDIPKDKLASMIIDYKMLQQD